MQKKTRKTVTEKNVPLPTGRNIIFVDTNILIDDDDSINELRKGGNLLVVSLPVVHELDKFKNDPRLSHNVRRVIRLIDSLQEAGDQSLIIESGMNFSRLNLNPDKPDHQIIACLNYVNLKFLKGHDPYKGYDKVKMITNDFGVKILARSLNKKYQIVVEQYRKTRTKIHKKDLEIPFVYVSPDKVASDWNKGCLFPANGLKQTVSDGSAIIGYTSKKNKEKGDFVAVRRGDFFEIINPQIESCGIRPKRKKGNISPNWEQAVSLYYVLNHDFDCVFLQGPAGSGKTLLAIAAALEQQRKGIYSKVIIFRVPEPVDRKKTLGLLPGDAGAKIGLYLRPISQTLTRLLRQENYRNCDVGGSEVKKAVGKKKNGKTAPALSGQPFNKNSSNLEVYVDSIFEQNGFEVAILEYVRGENFDGVCIIVDDAQNLSLHEIKTLITRVGEGSKIIFTGDLAQIDSPYLDETSSGLAHAIKKMGSDPQVAVVTLKQTLRSRIASLAEKAL